MGATSRERYAVVSCHVERPLDDVVWTAYEALLHSIPNGFRIASLVRPPDRMYGEDEVLWLARVRGAARTGPLGHHTHWTAPDHARPTAKPESDRDEDPGARVLAEGAWLREHGLDPTLFCGGGWYTDLAVAEACARLGYVDCTVRPRRPAYLPADSPWASLATPGLVDLPSGGVLSAIPTTHSLGDLARALAAWRLPELVHVYFHDTDLLDRRRRMLLTSGLRVLARRAAVVDLDELATLVLPDAARIGWNDVARL